MQRFPNPGRAPRLSNPDTRIGVTWRNGTTSRDTYTVDQLRWNPWPEGASDYDIAFFWRAGS